MRDRRGNDYQVMQEPVFEGGRQVGWRPLFIVSPARQSDKALREAMGGMSGRQLRKWRLAKRHAP